MTKRCLIYCRTSGDDSDRDSLGSQEITCLEHAQKMGYEVIDVLKEDVKGVSGSDFYAPELQKSVSLAEDGRFDILLMRDLERYARLPLKSKIIEFELREAGVKIEFVWDKFEDSDDGEFMKEIRYAMAAKEKKTIVRRMKQGKTRNLKEGSFIVSGNPALGLASVKEGRLFKAVIVENEAQIIRLIFNLYVIDDLSLTGVAKKLNDDGVPTCLEIRGEKEHTKWYSIGVRNIIKNEVYAGKYIYGKIGKKTYHDKNTKKITKRIKNSDDNFISMDVPAIIPRGLWEKAQEKLIRNHQDAGRNAIEEYLLARRLKCSCDYRMNVTTTTKSKTGILYKYYRCPGRNRRTKHECHNFLKADLIDHMAWDWLNNLLTGDSLETKLKTYIEDRGREIERLTEKARPIANYLKEVEKKYDNLVRSIMSSDSYGQSKLQPFKTELEKEMQELETKNKENQEEIFKLQANLNAYQVVIGYSEAYFQFGEDENTIHLLGDEMPIEAKIDYVGNLAGDEFMGTIQKMRENHPVTFQEKLNLVKRFNLQGELLEGEQIKFTCDLGQGIFELYTDPLLLVSVKLRRK